MKNDSNGKGQHGSYHHIISRSIGGPDVPENRYRWAKKKHSAYHQLFHNFLPSIVIAVISLWTDRNGELIPQKVGARGMKAWRKAFMGGNPAQAINFIQKNFLPAERMFLNGELGDKKRDR